MPSYEKNKSSGLWSCRFREPDENGITHQRRLSGFHTKREAQYGYEDYIKQRKRSARNKPDWLLLPPIRAVCSSTICWISIWTLPNIV